MSDTKKSYKDEGVYYLTGTIDDTSIKPCIEWILNENLEMKHSRLTILITSPGGYVYECFALIDIIRGSRIPIDTVGLGCIASCGLLLFLQGEERMLTPNTYVLAHQHSAGTYGKYHELVANMKGDDWIHKRLVTIFCERLKMKKSKVEKVFFPPSDVMISAEEAIEYGVATKVSLV